jgi:hypothetical protein
MGCGGSTLAYESGNGQARVRTGGCSHFLVNLCHDMQSHERETLL